MGKVTSQIMSKDMIDSKNKANVNVNELNLLLGVTTSSFQTTYNSNGNLTQTKEFDSNNNLLIQNDISYNADGTVNTITEIVNGKTHVITLNYVSGSLSTTNPYNRSVV